MFIAFEPHTGFRYVEVRSQRTAVDYAQFMQPLWALYPHAVAIRLVQDNLNTHTPGSFYEVMLPQQTFEMSQRFELHYTPKRAVGLTWPKSSWPRLSANVWIGVSRIWISYEQKCWPGLITKMNNSVPLTGLSPNTMPEKSLNDTTTM
ncbi:MAG: transposase [candidate division Zixibacteria bacterium]|nr:transposase [candidate division Zixibacteria bacterium]